MAKVLVIEDNDNLRLVFEMFLVQANHEVIPAENGPKGLEILKSDPLPDIILLDLILPGGMDGRSVTEILSADERLSKIPVVIVSGLVSTKILHDITYDAYISKPFNIDDVLFVIEKLTSPDWKRGDKIHFD